MILIAVILLLPFLGTTLGSAGVFFPVLDRQETYTRFLTGFAAGVMVAASIWSLIIPAIDQSGGSFFPALTGIWAGFLFLLLLDHTLPHLHRGSRDPEGKHMEISRTTMLTFAVALHNLPEGMAVGVAAAGWLTGSGIDFTPLLSLSLGIAIQNIPEGAIISMPLHAEGIGRKKAFGAGVLSGAIEPIAGFLTLLLAAVAAPVLPYFLSFAAGAMLYVVVEELIPEMTEGTHSDIGVIAFCTGFTLMMTLDVALG